MAEEGDDRGQAKRESAIAAYTSRVELSRTFALAGAGRSAAMSPGIAMD